LRLLAISHDLPPALYPQAIQIGRLLAHCDGEIGAVCAPANGSRALDHDFGLAERLAFRLEVAFAPRLPSIALRLARRFVPLYARIPDEFRAWVPLAEAATVAQLAGSDFKPDVLATFGEPMSDHLLGLRLAARLKLPWLAHFSDPWADSAFRRRDRLANIINRRLERQVIARADRVVFVSQETLDLVMEKYPAAWREKARVVPHSFDPALFPPPAPRGEIIVVRHIGNFYGHRSPVPLFRALKRILDSAPQSLADVRIELVGHLSWRFRMHPSLRALPACLVKLVDTVPYSESLRLMSGADLLLTIDAPDDISVFLPSKLIEYVGSETPIFGIVPPGASASLLARCGASAADPRNPSEVAEQLKLALQSVRERRRSCTGAPDGDAGWGDARVRSEFHIDRVAATFSALLQSVTAEGARGLNTAATDGQPASALPYSTAFETAAMPRCGDGATAFPLARPALKRR
jgi:glycosyltransferase involved in cell wall biosynthesis